MWLRLARKTLPVLPLFSRQVVLALFSLGFGIYFARHYELAEYARFTNLLILLAFIAAISDGSFYIPLMARGENVQLTDKVFSAHFLVCFAAALLIVGLSPILSRRLFLSSDVFILMGLGLLISPFQAANQLKFERWGQFGLNALTEVTQSFIFFVVLTILFPLNQRTGISLGWAFFARAVIGAVLAFSFARYSPRMNLTALPMVDITNGLRLVGINLLGFLNAVASPLILGSYFGRREVGVVNWATSNAQYLQQPFLIMNRFLIPHFSQHGSLAPGNIYRLFSVGYFAILLTLFVTAHSLVTAVFGAKWSPYTFFLYGVILTTLFVPISVPTGAIANSSGKSGLILNANVVRLALYWTALIISSKIEMGIWSFVVAQAIAEVVHIPIFLLVLGKVGWPILRDYAQILALALLTIGALFVWGWPQKDEPIWLMLLVLMACLSFFLGGCRLLIQRGREVPKEQVV